MKIVDQPEVIKPMTGQRRLLQVSFEVFPPKTTDKFAKLDRTCEKLNELKPDFFSVTFGAAGSSQPKTLVAVQRLVNKNLTVAPHISCVGMTSEKLLEILETYKSLGINRLVVVRGDFPADAAYLNAEFKYAAELIAFIRKKTGDYFYIIAAAYPEFHPQAVNSKEDLIHFKRKIEAGANCAITQFFFNSDAYFHFLENCSRIGIHIPIVPGILPIYDYQKLLSFAESCGAEIPLWLRKRLEVFSDDPSSIEMLGLEVVTKLCQSLVAQGVEKLHFYTLNQKKLVWKIYNSCRSFNDV